MTCANIKTACVKDFIQLINLTKRLKLVQNLFKSDIKQEYDELVDYIQN